MRRSPRPRLILLLALGALVAGWFGGPARAQEPAGVEPVDDGAPSPEPDPEAEGYREEITVVATTTERDSFETPRAITVVTDQEIYRENHLSLVDALDDRIGIWIEKRTTTTSDPVIRGLSGSNLLALVDGNTLSTFWGEGGYAGDDMYGKVDADSIERIEVLRGPQSVLYGSNALGGVLRFFTRSCPLDFTDGGTEFGYRLRGSRGSAADESRLRAETYGASRNFRFILGGSWRDVDDVRVGGGGTQTPTSGEDRNWDFKGEWRLAPEQELLLAVQDVHRTHVHRYYRPTQDNDNDREAVTLTYRRGKAGPAWDNLEATAYYQDKTDLRRFYDQGSYGIAHTRTWSGGVRMVRELGPAHRLTYGLYLQRDEGESADDEQFTIYTPEGEKLKAAPDTVWDDLGLYLQDEWEVAPRLDLIANLRFDRFEIESDPDEFYQPPGAWDPEEDRIRVGDNSLIGGLGLVYRLSDSLHLVGNYSRGYRLWAPKFGATQHAYGVVVPNGLLDPVTGDTFEAGLKSRSARFASSTFIYYTFFRDWQIIVPGTFDGSDWYDYNQNGERDEDESVYVIESSGDAYVYGVEAEARYRLGAPSSKLRNVEIGGGFAWNYGEDEESGDPLRHTQPAEGRLFIGWDRPGPRLRPWCRLGVAIVGQYDRIPPDRLLNDPGYRLDPQDMSSPLLREYGLPGYSVFDLRGGVDFGNGLGVTVGVENLLDKRYRQAHSRWDESGINVIVGLGYEGRF